ncbi:MAG: hypothetical protein PHP22_07090 [Oscillospiraceae bacterium]|nr:hypothetical protein [Oscillospiraceae bacterium]
MFQILLTPAAGKRLIGRATATRIFESPAIRDGKVAVIAGTTNAYVAEELLQMLGQAESFSRRRFFRGITMGKQRETDEAGRLAGDREFFGDVIIEKGRFTPGQTIDDVVAGFGAGDIIVKGANCVNRSAGQAGVLIGHPQGGTIMKILPAVIGRRVRLMLPVGLEKRVDDDINRITELLNAPDSGGYRIMPVTGEIITEIEAIKILYGLDARLVAAGGVAGAEGAIWLAIEGSDKLSDSAGTELRTLNSEPPFKV